MRKNQNETKLNEIWNNINNKIIVFEKELIKKSPIFQEENILNNSNDKNFIYDQNIFQEEIQEISKKNKIKKFFKIEIKNIQDSNQFFKIKIHILQNENYKKISKDLEITIRDGKILVNKEIIIFKNTLIEIIIINILNNKIEKLNFKVTKNLTKKSIEFNDIKFDLFFSQTNHLITLQSLENYIFLKKEYLDIFFLQIEKNKLNEIFFLIDLEFKENNSSNEFHLNSNFFTVEELYEGIYFEIPKRNEENYSLKIIIKNIKDEIKDIFNLQTIKEKNILKSKKMNINLLFHDLIKKEEIFLLENVIKEGKSQFINELSQKIQKLFFLPIFFTYNISLEFLYNIMNNKSFNINIILLINNFNSNLILEKFLDLFDVKNINEIYLKFLYFFLKYYHKELSSKNINLINLILFKFI